MIKDNILIAEIVLNVKNAITETGQANKACTGRSGRMAKFRPIDILIIEG